VTSAFKLCVFLLAFLVFPGCSPLPRVLGRSSYYEQTYFPASHNFAFRNRFPGIDGLFNAFDYGHSVLAETLWRNPDTPREVLDEKQFRFITTRLLRRPPAVTLDEAAIAPEWAKLAPEVVEMFDWAHMLHRQLYDVWADDRILLKEKDHRVSDVIRYYRSRPDVAFSSTPKSMALMEGQPYSLSFRKRFPTYNGLIWSYHWLQMALYDALMIPATVAGRKSHVAGVVDQFWRMLDSGGSALPTTMPQSAAIAPCFSARYPEAAIIFDNLHSLHDVVSDILADPSIPRHRKREGILLAAARYRDSTSLVTSVEEWLSMSREMGIQQMGGAPAIPPGCNGES
jgi:hypothetical protein